MSTTNILELKDYESDNDTELDEENLYKNIVDLFLPLKTRLKALNLYYKKEGGNNTIDIINQLCMLYQISHTVRIKKYLYAICEASEIEPFLKSIAAKSLCSYGDDKGYELLNNILSKLDKTIGTPYKIDIIKLLMTRKEYKKESLNYFCKIINNNSFSSEYRYKLILSLEVDSKEIKNTEEKKEPKFIYFIQESCKEYFFNNLNENSYRILSAQYILSNCKQYGYKMDTRDIELELLKYAENEKNQYNSRADATDVLLQYSKGIIKEKAQKLILQLGRQNKKGCTIYDNAQNVHNQSIEKSVLKGIEFLNTFKLMEEKGEPINFDYVKYRINDLIKDKDENTKDKINISLNRILMDRVLYSKYNCTLLNILLKIWTYISNHKYEKEMLKRLLEELVDMAGTCSSGYVERLVNSISSFGDFSLRISWREQIIGNFSGRLNARARKIKRQDIKEKVLEEMILETDKYEERKHFLRFLRKHLLSIREEMYEEFKDYIDDATYDLYFRFAVSHYETGSFV